MKKTVIILAIVAAALSCAKESSVKEAAEKTKNVNLVEMTFTVAPETKAVLQNDRSVVFAPGDKISIFANGTNYEFSTAEGGATATFTGTGEEATTYYALYPYNADATIDAGTIQNVSIGSGSAGTGTGTFNSQRAVAVAISNSTSLTFKQVTALLKLTVPAEVTDLKEIVVFNKDNGDANKAGAITGTFNVTPVDGDAAPTYEVTTPKFQTGFVGPSGSENPVPAGDYYIPVLPAQLTAKKGLELKLAFFNNIDGASGKDGRAFNGTGLKLERGKVYNLGVVKKTAEFVYDNFESGTISSDDYTGNTGALAVIENPVKTAANGSNYVMKNDMSESSGSTSGYIQVKTASNNGYTKFPSSVRGNYNKIRIKMYLGTNAYYPRARRGSDTAVRPALLNGVAILDQASWEAAVKTDDWNILEWNISQLVSGWTSLTNMQTIEFRPFVNWDGSNTSGFDETTNNRLIYIDDITFVLE